jgi:hypothetical protein
MSEGTPIDAIENGDVSDAADSQHMQAILNEMNASGADIANGPGVPHVEQQGMPMRPQHPPMYNSVPPPQYQQQEHRQYVDEAPYHPPPRKNIMTSTVDRIIDPLVVSIILFVLSLPVLHTYAGRYASWAFAIGGQLSWLGLIAISLVGGAIFGIYRASRDILGL